MLARRFRTNRVVLCLAVASELKDLWTCVIKLRLVVVPFLLLTVLPEVFTPLESTTLEAMSTVSFRSIPLCGVLVSSMTSFSVPWALLGPVVDNCYDERRTLDVASIETYLL